ncbi:hypothetical protein CMV_003444 [Castanea mollissima]|uniref:Uncharacterized protein n=1 Tax=Castanea mollissima TaxID=60419 RepID=A0A8J4S0B8_9ROSI|nr:hypothetical protein CMV_003444 [Castanea mollissima]
MWASWVVGCNSLYPAIQRSLFYGASLVSLLNLNCNSSKTSAISSIDWSIMFPFALWSLWLHRNNMAFDRAHNPQNLKTEALARASEFFYLGINGKQIRTKQKIQDNNHEKDPNKERLKDCHINRVFGSSWMPQPELIGNSDTATGERRKSTIE